MSHQQPNPPTEPLLTVAGITTAATAVLALLAAFGLPFDNNQQAAILGVIAVAAPLIVGWAARGRVYSPATVDRLLREQGQGE